MTDPTPHDALEIKATINQMGLTHAAFDSAVTESAQSNDPLLNDKVERLSADLSQLTRKLDQLHRQNARPNLSQSETKAKSDHAKAFTDRYLRKGHEFGASESKAFNLTVAADGGVAVPEEFDQNIETRLRDISPIRNVATVVQIGSSQYRKLVATSGFGSGWLAENAARPETTTPTFVEILPNWGELYANPAATQAMLDDAVFDVEAWLADEVALEFAKQESAAFINGNGTNRPRGILNYTTAATNDSVRAFGTLQHVPTGVAGNFAATDPADRLIDLVHALRPAYRSGATFVMNTNTMARIRRFKDLEGNYLWRPSLVDGQPATLLGYPVIEAEEMPDIAADSLSVAFGNFQRGYLIADRMGARVLRDPYSNKPFVHFYTTKRTGGVIMNTEAIKLLRFATT